MSPQRKPIYSIHEDDAELQDSIGGFVVSLAERIDGLQDLHSTGDFDHLTELAREMAEEADRLGYPLLASVARVVVDASGESKGEASEEALVEMSEISQRIRQAHRGAA